MLPPIIGPAQPNLPAIEPNEADLIEDALRQPLAAKIESTLVLLREFEALALALSPDGYWLAFSGGKDSQCILELARMAGVTHRPAYNVTTIDAPELVRFIRREYPEVEFNRPGTHLLNYMQEHPKSPPTRTQRWCCAEYKERGGTGMAKIVGVRIAESPRRAKLWRTVVPNRNGGVILCPIAYWTDADVWAFHAERHLPHCELYDEGFTRLGCIGCPLAGPANQAREFARWPRYAAMWHRAVVATWERWHSVPRNDGKPRYHARFSDGESFWRWWISGERQGPEQSCQGEFLFGETREEP
jgi:phosphoadenosine phosphosulfate reductase